jgi:hypothetical protein
MIMQATSFRHSAEKASVFLSNISIKEQELNNFDAFLYGRTAVRPFRRQNVRSYLIRDPKRELGDAKNLS